MCTVLKERNAIRVEGTQGKVDETHWGEERNIQELYL